MNHDAYEDAYIRGILTGVKTIAMVGASPVNVRPSYFAFKYLAERGYDMIPINPGQVGKSLVGKPFVGSLKDIGSPSRHGRHLPQLRSCRPDRRRGVAAADIAEGDLDAARRAQRRRPQPRRKLPASRS